ncbi:MAG: large-conductance mechanosensitive channel protein MscL [Butyricicoccus sp.]
MLKEFKEFALKGNVFDMAVGVIVGGAFGKIVTSLVNDIIMPLIGLLLGGLDFTSLKILLSDAVLNEAGEVVKEASYLAYGNFIQNIVDFLIIAFSIFMMVKVANKMHKQKEEAPAPEPPKGPTTEELLADILAELKNK